MGRRPLAGIENAVGTLQLSTDNPLRGARVKRLRVTPSGSTNCEMLEDRGAYKTGDRLTVAAGEFRRDVQR